MRHHACCCRAPAAAAAAAVALPVLLAIEAALSEAKQALRVLLTLPLLLLWTMRPSARRPAPVLTKMVLFCGGVGGRAKDS
jgi:hypothetical protein